MPSSDELLAQMKLLHPRLIDLSLGRVERLLAKLDNPHQKLPPVIHIAGTNGKGSVTAYLKAILQAAGKRVHAYTSPHLVRFHERIELAGDDGRARPIDEDTLVDVLSRSQAVNDGDDITQFEITTAAAFLAFAEADADVLLLEVGLGGRLDATNVVDQPELTVITPVSLDHADKLGATVSLIASEKAGILKSSVDCVVALQEPDAMLSIEKEAQRKGVNLIVWGQHYDAYEQGGRLVFQRENELLDLPMPALVGAHQVINAGTAIAAARALKRFNVSEAAIEQGLLNVNWPARMQHLKKGPLPSLLAGNSELWLDGGHNPSAARFVAETLADLEERSPKPLSLVLGMLGLKDAGGYLTSFRGLAREVIAVPVPGANEATYTPKALADIARENGFIAHEADSVEAALKMVSANAKEAQRVLIGGSLYLAGHVLALQDGVEPQTN